MSVNTVKNTRIPYEHAKELAVLFRDFNVDLDNGSPYFPPLPSLPSIHRCIVSIQASRIKKSGLYQEKMVMTGVNDRSNCPGGK